MVDTEFLETIKKNKDLKRFYMKRIAAIDLGSNAIRLTIAEVHSPHHYKILEKFRFPVRIGGDVFETGEVSQSKIDDMLIEFILIKRKISALKEADVLSSAKKIKKFEHNYCMLNKANKEQ